MQLSTDELARRLPPIDQLIQTYYLNIETSFSLSRSIYSNAINVSQPVMSLVYTLQCWRWNKELGHSSVVTHFVAFRYQSTLFVMIIFEYALEICVKGKYTNCWTVCRFRYLPQCFVDICASCIDEASTEIKMAKIMTTGFLSIRTENTHFQLPNCRHCKQQKVCYHGCNQAKYKGSYAKNRRISGS